ncbi:hypothetical protein GCM10020256_26820 [Streptomyces thermocoprophilus]
MGVGEAFHESGALGPAAGVRVCAEHREQAGEQGDAGGEGDERVEFHRSCVLPACLPVCLSACFCLAACLCLSYRASRTASWSGVCATPNACGTGWPAM